MLLRISVLALVLFAPACAAADAAHKDNIRIATDRIADAIIQEGVPAVSAAVAIGGELVWSDDFGAADKATGAITATLDGAPIRLDEIMIGRQGYVHMVFHDGRIPTPLVVRYPHRVSLKIRKRGDRLTGCILTEGRPQTDRIGSALGSWVELRPSAEL